jgi:hypothetical protein
MVWKGIQVHDVMQQAVFCAVGRGKFSWQDLIFGALSRQSTNDVSGRLDGLDLPKGMASA